jgi:hypothetical protein
MTTAPFWRHTLVMQALIVGAVLASPMPGLAQNPPLTTGSSSGPGWMELSAAERQVLQPLQAQWAGIDALRKQKWRDVAARHASLTAVQQQRLRERMSEWAAMTSAQRNAARLNFEDLRNVPVTERQTRWEAYRNLPEEQRQALITQAGSRPTAASAPQAAAVRRTPAVEGLQPKSNIVATPAPQNPRPKPVAPGTVQAGVGASTRPISKPPTPPRHQQAGLPKIAAGPDFIQSETLLPQRGPQGAGAGPVARPDVP